MVASWVPCKKLAKKEFYGSQERRGLSALEGRECYITLSHKYCTSKIHNYFQCHVIPVLRTRFASVIHRHRCSQNLLRRWTASLMGFTTNAIHVLSIHAYQEQLVIPFTLTGDCSGSSKLRQVPGKWDSRRIASATPPCDGEILGIGGYGHACQISGTGESG